MSHLENRNCNIEIQTKQENFLQLIIKIKLTLKMPINHPSFINHPSLSQNQNTSASSECKKSSSSEIYSKKWTIPENILYARYLKTHMSQMTNQNKKRCGKFVKMANFIGSKTENQCRSHHQKIMLNFHSIQNAIKYASQLKRVGELITPQKFEENNINDLQNKDEKQKIQKMEEYLTIQKQSEYTFHESKKDQIESESSLMRDFPISLEQSVFHVSFLIEDNIFDVLNMDAAHKYSQYFTC